MRFIDLAPLMTPSLDRLLAIMARLRDPDTGCEWDRAQTFASIAPYTLEEAYEVADAIARNDLDDLREELGDLLLQVVFHARMAEEAGAFDFDAVAASIVAKLETRHPHIFGDAAAEGSQRRRWEEHKARERAAKGALSAMDGIADALPALVRAEKVQQRAARDGFDWPDTDGPAAKVVEEMAELASARTDTERAEEAGDLLFAAVNLVRRHGVSPEEALRAANTKFARRYRAMEALAAQSGHPFGTLTLEEQEALWQAVKAEERAPTH
jgi:ATP diphosphatase